MVGEVCGIQWRITHSSTRKVWLSTIPFFSNPDF
jgi:hypothetical protein